MNYYLIDYENVKTDGLKDLSSIQTGDTIILFYSEQCKNISLDIMENIVNRNIHFSCHKVITGTKNALDFQLSSHLGYLIGQNSPDAKYYIISNDKGFDCLCNYWKKLATSVERLSFQTPQVPPSPVLPQESEPNQQPKKKSMVKESDLATLEEIKNLLADKDEPDTVLKIFNQYKTKQAICNGMSKHFKDSKRTSTIYKKLKPLLKAKNKS